MYRIKLAVVAALLGAQFGLLPAPALAAGQGRWDRYEDRWDRREDRRDRREDRRDRREDYRDRREDRRDRYDTRRPMSPAYWDAARYYRPSYGPYGQYPPRRMGRNDRIYRGSDDRYYCRRDDGTTGLIIGGIAGGVLGHVIAPGGSKTLGTIIGAGAGALLGRAVDDGDIVCR